MHRREREVTDEKKIQDILSSCEVIRVAIADVKAPYILPLNFGHEWVGETLCFYMHGALQGRKVDLAKSSPTVGFEMDTKHSLVTGEKACDYSYRYASIIGIGELCLVTEFEEKRHGLDVLMNQFGADTPKEYSDARINGTSVFKLVVQEYSVKSNILVYIEKK